jgi:hypothetical protein
MAINRKKTQKTAPSLLAYTDLATNLSGNRTYFVAIILGISVGTTFCIAGFVLALLGTSGSIELVVKAVDLEARLINASPGIALAFMGVIIVWRYKPNVSEEVRLQPRRAWLTSPPLDLPTRKRPETPDESIGEVSNSFPERMSHPGRFGENSTDFYYKGSK